MDNANWKKEEKNLEVGATSPAAFPATQAACRFGGFFRKEDEGSLWRLLAAFPAVLSGGWGCVRLRALGGASRPMGSLAFMCKLCPCMKISTINCFMKYSIMKIRLLFYFYFFQIFSFCKKKKKNYYS